MEGEKLKDDITWIHDQLGQGNKKALEERQKSVEQVVAGLDNGRLRVAEPKSEGPKTPKPHVLFI